MRIHPPDVREQRLRENIELLIAFIEASVDADFKWKIDVPTSDLTVFKLRSAVNKLIDAVLKARCERDELAGRLAHLRRFE